jgi:hypothetical protein
MVSLPSITTRMGQVTWVPMVHQSRILKDWHIGGKTDDVVKWVIKEIQAANDAGV